MEISSVLILALAVLLLLSLVVFSLEMFIPLQIQFKMNDICRPYMFLIESSGNLTEKDINQLKSELEKNHLSNPSIVLNFEGSKFGDQIHVFVQGQYSRKSLIHMYQRETENMVMKYEKTISIRKILN